MTALLACIPWSTWQPKILDFLPEYDRRMSTSDLVAGTTVGIVALPLAMAFSNMPPFDEAAE